MSLATIILIVAATFTPLSLATIVPVVPALLDRLFDAVLDLPANRLQRLIHLLLHFLLGQPERLLHLLAHRVCDLPLEIAKNGLDCLPNLILKHLAQSLGAVLVAFLTAAGLIRALVVSLAPRFLLPAVLLSLRARASVLTVGLRLPLPPPALCPLVFVGSLCPSRLFDGHNISLLRLT